MDSSWTTCPGCGLWLPGRPGELHEGRGMSEACWQVYGEVTGHELANVATLGRLHQLTVDAYSAQHPGGTSAMGLAFALIGLRLAFEDGWSALEVRAAHQLLARDREGWASLGPAPEAPAYRLTVFDVALAESPAEHADLVGRWATEVWAAWSGIHDQVGSLVAARLDPASIARLRADARR